MIGIVAHRNTYYLWSSSYCMLETAQKVFNLLIPVLGTRLIMIRFEFVPFLHNDPFHAEPKCHEN